MAARPRIFLDSNVLIYAYSASDPHKRERARALADNPGAVISTQVLSEFANIDGVLHIVSPFAPAAHQRRARYRT